MQERLVIIVKQLNVFKERCMYQYANKTLHNIIIVI